MHRLKSLLQRTMALLLTCALAATFLTGPVHAQTTVVTQINSLPLGAKIQVRLKNMQILRGTRGPVSESGFALLDAQAAARQLTFDEVTSVKLARKSHTVRYVVLGVVIVVAVVLSIKLARAASAYGQLY